MKIEYGDMSVREMGEYCDRTICGSCELPICFIKIFKETNLDKQIEILGFERSEK